VNLRHSNFEGAILKDTDFTGANYDSHTLDTIPKNDRDLLKKQGKLWQNE
jgi:Pentapeptide repeats (8 copies).